MARQSGLTSLMLHEFTLTIDPTTNGTIEVNPVHREQVILTRRFLQMAAAFPAGQEHAAAPAARPLPLPMTLVWSL